MKRSQSSFTMRALPVVDLFTRECLAIIAAGQPITEADEVASLAAIREHGAPARLLCDDGSDFPSQALDLSASRHGVAIERAKQGYEVPALSCS